MIFFKINALKWQSIMSKLERILRPSSQSNVCMILPLPPDAKTREYRHLKKSGNTKMQVVRREKKVRWRSLPRARSRTGIFRQNSKEVRLQEPGNCSSYRWLPYGKLPPLHYRIKSGSKKNKCLIPWRDYVSSFNQIFSHLWGRLIHLNLNAIDIPATPKEILTPTLHGGRGNNHKYLHINKSSVKLQVSDLRATICCLVNNQVK